MGINSIKIEQKAPEIALPDQDGVVHKLSDYLGKWVLVYFYPEDDTPGCTKEACGFRDNLPHFEKLDAVILGVSPDTVESHKKFEEKYGLPFTLLADPEKKTIEAYGVWREKNNFGRTYMGVARMSFLVNPSGEIAKIYEVAKAEDHPAEVVEDLKHLQNV